jgi:hypothetical protein
MINLQSEFIEFHDKIKLSYDDNTELREKRDILLKKLKDKIVAGAASFSNFNQGSYAMNTGIKPDNGDYDIDVGLRFNLTRSDYPDPVSVKQWVFDALNGHTKKVEIRRSCVTVTYQEDGEDAYHVDFACYADETDSLYIAKGKMSSSDDNRYWEKSDPLGLIDKINNLFSNDDDRAQFRRVIRYMKKWKNKHFDSSGNNAPTGIAITALAYDKFSPSYEINVATGKRSYNDFAALKAFVSKCRAVFTLKYDAQDAKFYHTITQNLFVEPYNDLFAKMTLKQQDTFYNKLCNMLSSLEEAEKKDKKSEACSILAEVFGSDFPVKTERSYVGHSESA